MQSRTGQTHIMIGPDMFQLHANQPAVLSQIIVGHRPVLDVLTLSMFVSRDNIEITGLLHGDFVDQAFVVKTEALAFQNALFI